MQAKVNAAKGSCGIVSLKSMQRLLQRFRRPSYQSHFHPAEMDARGCGETVEEDEEMEGR